MNSPRQLDLREARRVYAAGGNVTEYLRTARGVTSNTDEIIEIAYDLQAGSYAAAAERAREPLQAFAKEAADVINRHTEGAATFLDVGTGELTTLSFLAGHLQNAAKLLAFDISWSRLRHGLQFASACMPAHALATLEVFAADMASIPLPPRSVDVVISNHALEPNGGREEALLSELFRVARCKVVLFEPSFENNSAEGQERMARLGYVRDLAGAATRLGGTVVETVRMQRVANPLNPTYAHVLVPPNALPARSTTTPTVFADPGSDGELVRHADCFYSPRHGLAYPILQGVPLFLARSAFLASALDRFPSAP